MSAVTSWVRSGLVRALGCLLLIPAGAFASNLIMVTGGGTSYSNPFSFTTIDAGPEAYFVLDTDVVSDRLTINATVFLFPNENSITYAFTAGNYSNHSLSFTFDFEMELPDLSAYYRANSGVSGNGTAAAGPFTVTPAPGNSTILSAFASQFGGPLVSLGIDNGAACASGGAPSFVCENPPLQSEFAAAHYTKLYGSLAFQLPGSDQADSSHANYIGWDGVVALEPVPEPATFVLAGAGLIAVAFAARQRGRRTSGR
jgi:hypothetical protein